MKRRKFISGVSTAAAGTVIMPGLMGSEPLSVPYRDQQAKEKLTGFIVSDAHFGWAHQMQPDPSMQKDMMGKIMDKFPHLDVFIDTGDAHHNDHHDNADPHLARENWCDIIQGGCGQVPFHYVIGNHEIRSNEDDDPELRGCVMGSDACRPYYSFDMMGIHFISLPELVRAIHITSEEFAWLRLDLEVNRDKTIVLLSHNNILGTTSGNEAGYRGLMDSDKLMGIFRDYPNIIAWMHGHNHNYEIVRKGDMLFVSNGRIGGFDPSGGQHGLGGIYFEIDRGGLKTRCYSAEKEMFLDNLSGELSAELVKATTFDQATPFAYSYGLGGAVDQQRIPVFNHHCGRDQEREVYIAGCADEIINDDPAMKRYTERHAWHGMDKILLAGRINHGNSVFEYADPGIRLKSNSDWWTTLTLPGDYNERYTYYRCPPNVAYRLRIDLTTYPEQQKGKQAMWLRLMVHDSSGRLLRIIQTEDIDLVEGNQKHEAILKVPALDEFDTIYSDPENDKMVNIAVVASFSGMEKGDVEISYVGFSMADARGPSTDPGLSVNGNPNIFSGKLEGDKIRRLPVDSRIMDRDLLEVSVAGNRRMSFLVRHTNLEWQVRNACVEDKGKYLAISKMRNKLSRSNEIILSPLRRTADPYISRIRNAEEIRVYPLSRGNNPLALDISKLNGTCQAEILSSKKPVEVKGSSSWTYRNNTVIADIEDVGTIEFYF